MTEIGGTIAWPAAYQVADHITRSSFGISLTPYQLADVISEITVETTITGAGLLAVQIIDPYWQVQRSGLCATDETGELANNVDINFPEGSDLWWRLAMVEGGNDLTAPNVTLTFIDRIVSYLQDDWGPLSVKAGTTTRAQFIAQLVARIPASIRDYAVLGEGKSTIDFVCPDENIVQPVASSSNSSNNPGVSGGVPVVGGAIQGKNAISPGTTTVMSAAQTAHASARKNKTPGLGGGAAVTVKGQPMNATQRGYANRILAIGQELKATSTATAAVVCEAIAESGMGLAMGWDAQNPTYGGLLAGSISNFGGLGSAASAAVTDAEIRSCFQGGKGYAAGGTIGLTRSSSDLLQVAATNSGSGSQFFSEAGHAQYASEATAIVAAGGGAAIGGLSTGTTGAATPTTSDVSQLTRGSTSNPDEDSWTCIQRLAGDVNWSAFSNGDTLYYMDGPTMIAQKPAAYLRLSGDGTTWQAVDPETGKTVVETPWGEPIITQLTFTFDNSAFAYQSTHKRRQRVQRRTAIRKPQTASRVQFNLVCGIFEFRAGDVIVFQDAGAINGRWIVEDTTRNVFADLFTQITLGPSTIPYPEPQATSSSSSASSALQGKNALGAGGSAGDGNASGAAQIAKQALARQQQYHCFHYAEVRPIQYNILTANPVVDDCSGFCIACYKLANLPDPSGNAYNGSGYTGDMVSNCTRVSIGDAQPGDLVFYGPPPCQHVTMYIGNGQVISMGTEGDPHQGGYTVMGPCAPYGIFRSNFVKTKLAQTTPSPRQTAQSVTTGRAAQQGVTKIGAIGDALGQLNRNLF